MERRRVEKGVADDPVAVVRDAAGKGLDGAWGIREADDARAGSPAKGRLVAVDDRAVTDDHVAVGRDGVGLAVEGSAGDVSEALHGALCPAEGFDAGGR